MTGLHSIYTIVQTTGESKDFNHWCSVWLFTRQFFSIESCHRRKTSEFCNYELLRPSLTFCRTSDDTSASESSDCTANDSDASDATDSASRSSTPTTLQEHLETLEDHQRQIASEARGFLPAPNFPSALLSLFERDAELGRTKPTHGQKKSRTHVEDDTWQF